MARRVHAPARGRITRRCNRSRARSRRLSATLGGATRDTVFGAANRFIATVQAHLVTLAATVRSCRSGLTYKLLELRVSAFGRTMAAGLVTFLAGGLGSILADRLGQAITAILVPVFGLAPAVAGPTARAAGLVAAIASGITAAPGVAKAALRESDPVAGLGPEFLGAITAGLNSIRGVGLTALAAGLLGGTFAALLPSGLYAAITAGVSAALASACGAVLTTGLGATLDAPFKSARAKAQKALKARKDETYRWSR